jgi:hypothetical protein
MTSAVGAIVGVIREGLGGIVGVFVGISVGTGGSVGMEDGGRTTSSIGASVRLFVGAIDAGSRTGLVEGVVSTGNAVGSAVFDAGEVEGLASGVDVGACVKDPSFDFLDDLVLFADLVDMGDLVDLILFVDLLSFPGVVPVLSFVLYHLPRMFEERTFFLVSSLLSLESFFERILEGAAEGISLGESDGIGDKLMLSPSSSSPLSGVLSLPNSSSSSLVLGCMDVLGAADGISDGKELWVGIVLLASSPLSTLSPLSAPFSLLLSSSSSSLALLVCIFVVGTADGTSNGRELTPGLLSLLFSSLSISSFASDSGAELLEGAMSASPEEEEVSFSAVGSDVEFFVVGATVVTDATLGEIVGDLDICGALVDLTLLYIVGPELGKLEGASDSSMHK